MIFRIYKGFFNAGVRFNNNNINICTHNMTTIVIEDTRNNHTVVLLNKCFLLVYMVHLKCYADYSFTIKNENVRYISNLAKVACKVSNYNNNNVYTDSLY